MGRSGPGGRARPVSSFARLDATGAGAAPGQWLANAKPSGGAVEIKPDLMVHLGYGKYWRSDDILGLVPIEEGRGPGRRTEVWVGTRQDPVVASRTENAILQDMASLPDEAARAAEMGSIAVGLLESFDDLSPLLRRMLKNEEGFDVEYWVRRLREAVRTAEELAEQEDLFG